MNDQEINRAVHEAMGLCTAVYSYGEAVRKCGCGAPHDSENTPDYCSDLNAAFKFVEFLDGEGYEFNLEKLAVPNIWEASFWDDYQRQAQDESPAKAICLAGLSALGITIAEEAKRSV
jgi:hypothetical protein